MLWKNLHKVICLGHCGGLWWKKSQVVGAENRQNQIQFISDFFFFSFFVLFCFVFGSSTYVSKVLVNSMAMEGILILVLVLSVSILILVLVYENVEYYILSCKLLFFFVVCLFSIAYLDFYTRMLDWYLKQTTQVFDFECMLKSFVWICHMLEQGHIKYVPLCLLFSARHHPNESKIVHHLCQGHQTLVLPKKIKIIIEIEE